MVRVIVFITALLQLALLTACNQSQSGAGQSSAPAPTNSATAGKRQVFHVRGVIREIVSPTRARIEHEAIPGYMPAMTMPLDTKNTNELAAVKVGDQVVFDMIVTDDDGWIENVTRVGETNLGKNNTNEVPHFRQVRDVDPLSVGDKMPDYPFITEEGKPLRLSELSGQAIGLTFIFTRCPFPTFCPRMTSNFEKVAAELSKSGSPTNWHLLSISFDPEYDTPQRLKEHAKRFQRDPAKWNFVTGEMIEIDAITEQFGLAFAKRNGTIDHNLRTVIIDASGHIRQIYIGNEWDVNEFISEMKKAAAEPPAGKT